MPLYIFNRAFVVRLQKMLHTLERTTLLKSVGGLSKLGRISEDEGSHHRLPSASVKRNHNGYRIAVLERSRQVNGCTECRAVYQYEKRHYLAGELIAYLTVKCRAETP
jgi:hypothetical protein